MALRLGILFVFLAIISFFLPTDSMAFYAFMALAYIVTIPYSLWLRSEEHLREYLPLQFVVDLVVVTGLVYFTGGIHSDLSLLYPLVILSAGLVTTAQRAIQVTVLSIAVYATMVALTTQGILVPYVPGMEYTAGSWSEVIKTMLVRILVFACFGLGSVYIARRCHFLDHRAERYRKMAELIFQNMPVGLLVLDRDGFIVGGNDRMGTMLGRSMETMIGHPLPSLAVSGFKLPAVSQAGESFTIHLVRADGVEVPFRTHASIMTLPSDMLPQAVHDGDDAEVRLLTLRDISRITELRSQLENADRMLSAANLNERLADQVRPPLAAITWAAQVMQRLDYKVLVGQTMNDATLQNDISHLSECIITESSRLDSVMEKFIDLAEISPKTLTKIARMVDTVTVDA